MRSRFNAKRTSAPVPARGFMAGRVMTRRHSGAGTIPRGSAASHQRDSHLPPLLSQGAGHACWIPERGFGWECREPCLTGGRTNAKNSLNPVRKERGCRASDPRGSGWCGRWLAGPMLDLDSMSFRERTLASPVDDFLARYARSALELIADASSDVTRCPAPSCGMFYVRSRAAQLWCSPQCGSRARVARHYDNHRGQRAS